MGDESGDLDSTPGCVRRGRGCRSSNAPPLQATLCSESLFSGDGPGERCLGRRSSRRGSSPWGKWFDVRAEAQGGEVGRPFRFGGGVVRSRAGAVVTRRGGRRGGR